jgi:ketosteroid isomerase-like protein
LLDTKHWDDWADLFIDECVLDTSAAGGPPPITGRAAAVAMVREMLETAITGHQVHQPEISVDGDGALAIWAMQDRLVFGDGTRLSGFGHYTERYVREGEHWKIASSALTRLHLDVTPPA